MIDLACLLFHLNHDGCSVFRMLQEGVVFVLSGFVNPERGTLRSQALEMGAKYQPDWNLDSTLLICAFANTPKFHQVEADNGTIVSKVYFFPFGVYVYMMLISCKSIMIGRRLMPKEIVMRQVICASMK